MTEPCTCTIACIPQGITGEQTCKEALSALSEGNMVEGGRAVTLGNEPSVGARAAFPSESAAIDLEMFEVVSWKVWPYFAPHHYMTEKLNKASRAWVAATADGQLVGFNAILPFPHGALRNAWRSSRTVVLPDFQGLGLGVRLTEWVGEIVLWDMFGALYARTVHPRLGEYRNRSPAWVPTSTNQKKIAAMGEGPNSRITEWKTIERVAYSHRYVGYPEPKEKP